jgi:tetratricopeptide (TPR) repeat protein
MGFRVQKSIRLGDHMRINLSKSGIGASIHILGVTLGTGPRGAYMSADLPGSGLSYRKHLSGGRQTTRNAPPIQTQAEPAPKKPAPGFFAPGHEKELFKGEQAYQNGQVASALEHFLNAATQEPGAAIMAATLLVADEANRPRAVELLERVVQSDAPFPTPLMEKYLADVNITIQITPNLAVAVPVNGPAAILFLVELYQATQRVREAIALLEEVVELSSEPILLLSLCELYASGNLWEGIIDRAQAVEPKDDVTASIVIFYGQAMQVQQLHDAAISVFNKVLRKKSGRDPLVLREAAYGRAISYEAQGKSAQARREWELLYAEAPTFRDVAQRLSADKPSTL